MFYKYEKSKKFQALRPFINRSKVLLIQKFKYQVIGR